MAFERPEEFKGSPGFAVKPVSKQISCTTRTVSEALLVFQKYIRYQLATTLSSFSLLILPPTSTNNVFDLNEYIAWYVACSLF